MRHFNIKITGSVQGVSFRYLAKKEADKLGITGFIKNMPDGSVYIKAEGESSTLEKFVDWCQSGPSLAKVENIEVAEEKLQHYQDFVII